MSTLYGLIIKLSNNEKLQSKESVCLRILTIYSNIGPLFDMFTSAMFFSARLLNMCRPRTIFYFFWPTGPPGLEFCGSGPARSTSWLRMVNAGWLGSMRSKTFLKIKFFTFQGWPTEQAAFLPGLPAPYNQFLLQPLILVPEYYFQARLLKF